jgi:hypothetical protein
MFTSTVRNSVHFHFLNNIVLSLKEPPEDGLYIGRNMWRKSKQRKWKWIELRTVEVNISENSVKLSKLKHEVSLDVQGKSDMSM